MEQGYPAADPGDLLELLSIELVVGRVPEDEAEVVVRKRQILPVAHQGRFCAGVDIHREGVYRNAIGLAKEGIKLPEPCFQLLD